MVASKKWIQYLFKNPTILSDDQTSLSKQFKENVRDMGVKGLKELLNCLTKQKPIIEKMVDQTLLPFYAACSVEVWDEYVKTLTDYLKSQAYFPFNRLSINYVKQGEQKLVAFLSELNQLQQFESVKLS